MASGLYTESKKKIFDNDIDCVTDAAIKLMLVKSTYTFVATHEFVDNAGANDPIDEEADCTGYTGGFAGADRVVPASRASTVVGTAVEFSFNNNTWTALGNGTNNTLGGVILIKEITNDLASPVIAFDDLVGNVTTNGGDITYRPDDNGGSSGTMFDW